MFRQVGPAEILFILIFILLIMVTYRMARAKNRSPLLWVILVLLFTPLLLIVLAILPARSSPPTAAA